jgi:hypothetical protein
MNKLLSGVAALPFLATAAFAAQPLTNHQMDTVTAGFAAFATAGAESEGGVIETNTATVAEVANFATVKCCTISGTPDNETTLTIIKSVSASTSLSSAVSLPSNQGIP